VRSVLSRSFGLGNVAVPVREKALHEAARADRQAAYREVGGRTRLAAVGQGTVGRLGEQDLHRRRQVFAQLARQVHFQSKEILVADDQRRAEADTDAVVDVALAWDHRVDGREAPEDVQKRNQGAVERFADGLPTSL
jgi:hypothetical protein